ncbi:MAG TPA: hypothetical protein VKO20_03015 [Desulfosalsimonadaceae bacterium]|nr:hypothetical protein [Desulfosalsimonadaceae bacterium]
MDDQTLRQAKLPDEILEAQKTRSSLLRWKLLICAAIGSAGLGFTSQSSQAGIGLLALIPLTCAYVDLLCANLNLRMIIIGRYFADHGDSYETYISPRRVIFCLEDWALYGSTIMIACLLMMLAAGHFAYAIYAGATLNVSPVFECCQCVAIFLSCVITIVMTRWIVRAFRILSECGIREMDQAAFLQRLGEQDLFFRMLMKIFLREGKNANRTQ